MDNNDDINSKSCLSSHIDIDNQIQISHLWDAFNYPIIDVIMAIILFDNSNSD